MNPARRSARRRDWPAHLYEKRPGYYTYRDPRTGKEHVLGRIPFALAKNEALRANKHLAEKSVPDLVAMLDGSAGRTMADLVKDMPVSEKRSTRNTFRAQDKVIVEGALIGKERFKGLGAIRCSDLTVLHCAELLDVMVKAGKIAQAQAVRSRLSAVCARGIRKGWMNTNPADVTERPDGDVKRGRLTLEMFLAIREKAAAWPWLPRAMNLALVSGQDRSTVAAAQRKHIVDGRLICHRSKTRDKVRPLALPLRLRLDAVGLSLDDIVRESTGVLSHFLVHHVERQGRAKAGDPVGVNLITRSFSEARTRAGIPDVMSDGKGAPTFHEIRSLSKRLYEEQGGVDTKTLLGHTTEAMSRLYADTRDDTPIELHVVHVK